MAEARENSNVDNTKTDFLNRVETVKSEIRTKFLNLRKDLDDQELRALEKVEKIEREILEKCERASASLKEISQVREQVLTVLKSNATNELLKKNLKMYDDEIKEIQKSSNIDSTIKLVWNSEQLRSICEVSDIVDPSSQVPRNSEIHTPSSKKSGISKPPLSSPKVYVDKIPPVKIAGQSTKKIPILSPPKKPLLKSSLFINHNPDYDCDYDYESNSDSDPTDPQYESNSDSDPNPQYESNSDSDPNPDPYYESNSNSNPADPDYDHDYDSAPDPNYSYGYDHDYDYDPAPAPDYDYDYD